MPCTWKALATWGLVSTSTFASTTFPSVSAITFSMIGPSVLHGPHHSAQRSTTTGTDFERSTTSVAKVASVTSIDIGGALLLFGAWSPQPTGGATLGHRATRAPRGGWDEREQGDRPRQRDGVVRGQRGRSVKPATVRPDRRWPPEPHLRRPRCRRSPVRAATAEIGRARGWEKSWSDGEHVV